MKKCFGLVLAISMLVLIPSQLGAQDSSGVRCRRLSGKSSPRPKCTVDQADLDRFADYVIEQIRENSTGDDDDLLQVAKKLKQSDTQRVIRRDLEDRICDAGELAKESKFKDLEGELRSLLKPENLEDYRQELKLNPKLARRKCLWILCAIFRRCCS